MRLPVPLRDFDRLILHNGAVHTLDDCRHGRRRRRLRRRPRHRRRRARRRARRDAERRGARPGRRGRLPRLHRRPPSLLLRRHLRQLPRGPPPALPHARPTSWPSSRALRPSARRRASGSSWSATTRPTLTEPPQADALRPRPRRAAPSGAADPLHLPRGRAQHARPARSRPRRAARTTRPAAGWGAARARRARRARLRALLRPRRSGGARGAGRRRPRAAGSRAPTRYQERVLAAGITHVCDAAVPPSMEALYRDWQARGELHARRHHDAADREHVRRARRSPRRRRHRLGDGRLSVGALKLFTDGGTSCAMCLSLRDAIAQFGAHARQAAAPPLAGAVAAGAPAAGALRRRPPPAHRAALLRRRGAGRDGARGASARGFGVGIHAAGNEAIAPGDRCPRRRVPRRRCRRASTISSSSKGRRCAAPSTRGIHVVVQPVQLHRHRRLLRADRPARRGSPTRPTGQMLDAGAALAGSSDAPVFTFDVLAAIDTAVRRAAAERRRARPRAGASASHEALRMYTRGAAARSAWSGEIGQLCARRPRRRRRARARTLDGVPPERLATSASARPSPGGSSCASRG